MINSIKTMVIRFAGVILVVMLVSGCSQESKKDSSSVTIEWLRWPGKPGWERTIEEMVTQFEKENPGVRIKINTCSNGDYQSKLLTLASSDELPDIILSSLESGFFGLVLKYGLIYDLKPFIETDEEFKLSDFVECGIKAFTQDGKLYAIPVDLNPVILAYNKKLFDEAKLEYPSGSWDRDKLLEVAKKLTKDTNGDGRIDQYGFWYWGAFDWIKMAGIPLVDKDNKKVLFTKYKESEKVWQFLVDLRLKHKVSPSISETTEQSPFELFCTGRIAMMEIIPAYFWDLLKVKNLDWDISPVCRLNKKQNITTLPITGYSISSKTKYPKECWRFVKFMASPYVCKKMRETLGTIPPRKSMLNNPEVFSPPPGNIRKVIPEVLKTAETWPVFPEFSELNNKIVGDAFGKAAIGQISVKQALEEIEKKGNELLEKRTN